MIQYVLQNCLEHRSMEEFFHRSLTDRSVRPQTGSYDSKPSGDGRRLWLILGIMVWANFSIGVVVSLQAPFFPRMAESKGVTPSQYGWVFGLYQLAMFTAGPFWGLLVAKMSPKFMLGMGMFMVGVTTILFGLLDRCHDGTSFLTLALITRLLEGVGGVAVRTATFSSAADLFPDSVPSKIATLQAALGLGIVVGPTIGGVLQQLGGYEPPFIVAGSLILFNGLPVICLLKSHSSLYVETNVKVFIRFLCDPGIIIDGFNIFCMFCYVAFISSTIEPHVRQFHLSPLALGLVFIIGGGSFAVSSSLWGYLLHRKLNSIFVSYVCMALTMIGLTFIGPAFYIPLPTMLWMVIASWMIYGLGQGGKNIVAFSRSIENAVERGFPNDLGTYGMVSALMTSSGSLGGFVGPSLGGYIVEAWGFRKATVAMCGFEVTTCIAFTMYLMMTRKGCCSSGTSEREPLLSASVKYQNGATVEFETRKASHGPLGQKA